MFPLKISELVSLTGGTLINGSPERVVESISLDTRTLKEGDFFIPLRGERHDGHQFLAEALSKEAKGFFTERWNEGIRAPLLGNLRGDTVVIKVKDTLKALHSLARHVREQLDVEVVGITGSTGKTCTKDMLVSVLLQKLNLVYTEKSYNNEVGVPLTILKADYDADAVVVEMAMRGLGQIEELAEIAHPTVGLVTNVGKTHFEFLGSEEAIAIAKGELIEAIPPSGTVVLNEDDAWTGKLRSLSTAEVITYGISNSANVYADEINIDSSGRVSFKMISEGKSVEVKLPFPGRHNVYNALAAGAIGLHLGLSLSDVKKGLEGCTLSKMRMEVFTTADGVTVINDAYNANPTSMRAALFALRDMNRNSRRIAVLGDMLELGKIADVSHFEIGELVGELGVDLLITVGEKSRRIAEGALRRGLNSKNVFTCDGVTEAGRILREKTEPTDVVLVKASRGMGLEGVIDSLL